MSHRPRTLAIPQLHPNEERPQVLWDQHIRQPCTNNQGKPKATVCNHTTENRSHDAKPRTRNQKLQPCQMYVENQYSYRMAESPQGKPKSKQAAREAKSHNTHNTQRRTHGTQGRAAQKSKCVTTSKADNAHNIKARPYAAHGSPHVQNSQNTAGISENYRQRK